MGVSRRANRYSHSLVSIVILTTQNLESPVNHRLRSREHSTRVFAHHLQRHLQPLRRSHSAIRFESFGMQHHSTQGNPEQWDGNPDLGGRPDRVSTTRFSHAARRNGSGISSVGPTSSVVATRRAVPVPVSSGDAIRRIRFHAARPVPPVAGCRTVPTGRSRTTRERRRPCGFVR